METEYLLLKNKKDQKKLPKIPPSAMFSKNEKDLYREASTIKKKKFEETKSIEEKELLMKTVK